ncbi:hypothetical protein GCT13_07340 [Paraburkholderia sp. CNPSo 3157]|uniref:Uncharacterized protein n=1 Tax=Paraburkholderia franconis TaxID=2654983 RepID=A0A7X1TF36_9BURK|nr:hypothetical protein [Paraburkholderia franconis]MPW16754.1 hypothetical protein [Paraburkholderia franconis]
MSLIVAARFTTFPAAEAAAERLFGAGFVEEDVSLFFVNPRGQHDETNAARGIDAARCVLSLGFRRDRRPCSGCSECSECSEWFRASATRYESMSPIVHAFSDAMPGGSSPRPLARSAAFVLVFFIIQVVLEFVFVFEQDPAHTDAHILVRVRLARGVFVRGVILSDHWQLHEES